MPSQAMQPPVQPMLQQPGQQADLQMVSQLVEQLCSTQASNREEVEKLLAEVGELQRQLGQRSRSRSAGPHHPSHPYEESLISRDLSAALTALTKSQEAYAELADTANDYEDVMASIMIKVREFAAKHHQATLGWHKFYLQQIQELRDQNLQLRLEHQTWQEHLGKAMEYARKALQAQSAYECPLQEKIAGQRRQILVMRKLLGWEEWHELDDEDEQVVKEEELERTRVELERMRMDHESTSRVATGQPARQQS